MSVFNQPPPTYDDPYMTTTLTPYLQLSHLLSLTWLAYPILSLIFVAFRLQLSLAASQSAVANAKGDLLTSCKAAEQAATAAASMPRYMALATNEQFADAVNGSMNAARAALVLSLTAMEGIINFIIDLYRSTLLCFLELVVRGGLAILIGAVNEINTVLQSVTSSLRTGIQNDIGSANNIIKTAIDAINKVNPFGSINVPQINVPSLDGLQNIQLPPSFQDSLTQLNASLPSVGDIKEKLESIINTPFELLKKDINDTFAELSFNSSVLPVPEQNRLSFCNDLDTSVVDDIGRDFVKTAKIGVVILILLALLLIGLNCLLTWYKWRCMKAHLEYTRQAWSTDPTMARTKLSPGPTQIILSDHNLLMLQANSQHPLITRITNQVSARLRLTPSQHTHLQWFLNYIFHAPAIACFLIGFFGLLCVEIQLLAMGPLVAKYQGRATSAVSDFSVKIATSINDSMYNQSAVYANDVNGRVDAIQATINDGVFGWVNGTTTTLNTTVNEFYNDVQTAVSSVFNGTILESPATEFIRCFIGSKVDAIENALTFLHDNLKVDMPRVNESVLILSPESVNEATAPIAAAAIGGGAGDDQGLIGRLINSYADSLRKERVMFGIFLALWGFVVLMGICIILWHSYGEPMLEKRQRKKYQLEQRGGIDDFVAPAPYGSGRQSPPSEKWSGGEAVTRDLPSFTPLPSPNKSAFRPFWASRSNSPVDDDSRLGETREPFQNANLSSAEHLTSPVDKTVSRLKAIRMKMSKGRSKPQDEEEIANCSPAAEEEGQNKNRGTAWFGKVTSAFGGKKEPEQPEPEFWESFENRPKLKIIVDTASDISATERARGPHSRWSASPDATQTSWKNIMTPTKKSTTTTTTTTPTSSSTPSRTPIGLPARPSLRHKPSVPSDIGSSFDDPFLNSVKPAPYPVPLYNAYEPTFTSSPRPLPVPNYTPRPLQDSFPPPPMKSPRMYQPSQALAPPPRRHNRTSSVPVWRVTNLPPSEQPNMPENREGTTTRLLTTAHAHQSSSVNPFMTPFDDEHQVQIVSVPAMTRKSIPTNPFAVAI